MTANGFRWAPLYVAGIMGCTPHAVSDGISVGNPSMARLTTAASTDVTLRSGFARLQAVGVLDDEGTVHRTRIAETVDVLGEDTFDLPTGAWQRLTLHFAGDIHYQATTKSGAEIAFSLPVETVTLTPDDLDLEVDGDLYLTELAFPDWLAIERNREPLEEDPDSADLEERLVRAVERASALYTDFDRDGWLSPRDRAARQAVGDEREAP